MKPPIFVLCSLMLGTLAHAQPPATSDATANPPVWSGAMMPPAFQANEKYFEQIKILQRAAPYAVVSEFLRLTRVGNWQHAALCVAGADATSRVLAMLPPKTRDLRRVHAWEIDADKLTRDMGVNSQDVAEFEISLPLIARDEMGIATRKTETVKLKREGVKWEKIGGDAAGEAKIWRIVPPPAPPKNTLTIAQEFKSLGIIEVYAAIVARPEHSIWPVGKTRAEEKGKKLAVAFYDYLLENRMFEKGRTIDITPQNVREKLLPFLDDEQAFTAPGDARGVQSWKFNAALTGRKFDEFGHNSLIPLFYLGEENKLDDRYDGRALIVYADGHIQSKPVDAEIRWIP